MDLPQYGLCHGCVKLHKLDIPERNVDGCCMNTGGAYAHRCKGEGYTCTYAGFCISTFKIATKLHRLGRNFEPYMRLLTGIRTQNRDGYTYQHSWAPGIVEGNLLFRVQHWYRLPFGQDVRLPMDYSLNICPHWFNYKRNGFSELGRMAICAAGHWEYNQDKCGFCSGNWACKLCVTEFRIDFKSFGNDGVAVVVTTWLDLGEGRTPDDPKWMRRGGSLHAPSGFRTHDGCIAEAFEGQTFFNKRSILSPPDKDKLFRDNPHIDRKLAALEYDRFEQMVVKKWKKDPMSENRDIVLQPGQKMPGPGHYDRYRIRILPGGRRHTKSQTWNWQPEVGLVTPKVQAV